MTLRTLLLDWPGRLFDLWWALYRLVLGVALMVLVTLTALALALALIGIRWGW